MDSTIWYLITGALLLLMVLLQSEVRRLPVSAAMLYLLIGSVLGPQFVGLIQIDALRDSKLLETGSELAVLISLFTVGLKMRLPLQHRSWRLALSLAVPGMLITIVLVALTGVALGLPLGVALLLGAVLAPTDPVLASDVQLRDAGDRDQVRFGLTAEAGLNDGTAFPFLLLALGVLNLHEIDDGLRWLGVDLVWAVAAGLASGWLWGHAAGRLVLFLRREHRSAVGLDEFLALGLIALAYGSALALNGNGFLAVFACGLALRAVESRETPDGATAPPPADPSRAAVDRKAAPSHLMRSLLTFNEQLERIAEVAVVLVIGSLLRWDHFTLTSLSIAGALLLLIRPLAVFISAVPLDVPRSQLRLLGWFGIRGVGSLFYLMYAVDHGLAQGAAQQLVAIVLPVVAISIVVHGISATPLMERYQRTRTRKSRSG